jgi:hypothetical protein
VDPEAGAASSSKTLVSTYQTKCCHNTEDHNLNPHCCENLRSHTRKGTIYNTMIIHLAALAYICMTSSVSRLVKLKLFHFAYKMKYIKSMHMWK